MEGLVLKTVCAEQGAFGGVYALKSVRLGTVTILV